MSVLKLFTVGGIVMYPLVFISVINLSIVLYVFYEIYIYNKYYKQENFSKKMQEQKIFNMESVTVWLSNFAGLSTLLGLLGTVIGIYHSFQSIQISKEASPEIFAEGISQALITTIYGLSIAVPSIFFYHLLRYVINRLEFDVYISERLD